MDQGWAQYTGSGAFRHFFSHAYALDLDPERIEPLVADIRDVVSVLQAEIDRFLG
jgi:hypothetical protein